MSREKQSTIGLIIRDNSMLYDFVSILFPFPFFSPQILWALDIGDIPWIFFFPLTFHEYIHVHARS